MDCITYSRRRILYKKSKYELSDKDIFEYTSLMIILMLLAIGLVFLIILVLPSGRISDVSIAFLPALPSIILIVVTLLYVRATYRLLEETKLQREKPFIEQILKEILFPILDELKLKKDSYKTRKIISFKGQKWDSPISRRKIKEEIFVRYPEVNYKIFCKRYPDLAEKIIKIDEKLSSFNKGISDFVLKINTVKFKKKWGQNFKKYKETIESPIERQSLRRLSFSQINDAILFSIIHGEYSKVLPELFWEKHNKNILKIHKKNLEEIEKIDKWMEEIKNKAEETYRYVIDLINFEQEKYGILGKVTLD